jgi:hypothetical protein
LLGTVGRRDELVPPAHFQKPTQVAEAAGVGLHEHQMRRGERDVQESQTVAAFQELHHLRLPINIEYPNLGASARIQPGPHFAAFRSMPMIESHPLRQRRSIPMVISCRLPTRVSGIFEP